MKKFLALFMTFIMVFCFSVSAVAAEPEKVNDELSLVSEETVVSESVSEQAEPRASVGGVIAAGTTTLSNGVGIIKVNLPSGNFWADLVAQIDYTGDNSVISVSVVTPNNDVINLGGVSGSGNSTTPVEMTYAPAGDYTFSFYSPSSYPARVTAMICD